MQNHVTIDETASHLAIRIDDWELVDFIDNILTAQGFEHDYLTEETIGRRLWFVMHFPAGDDYARLRQLVNSIDPQEIQRIWEINNKTA